MLFRRSGIFTFHIILMWQSLKKIFCLCTATYSTLPIHCFCLCWLWPIPAFIPIYYPIFILKSAGPPLWKTSCKSQSASAMKSFKTLLFENLLAFPNPKSLRVFRVNRLCSTQVWLWLIITPEIGPKKETAAWDGFMFNYYLLTYKENFGCLNLDFYFDKNLVHFA